MVQEMRNKGVNEKFVIDFIKLEQQEKTLKEQGVWNETLEKVFNEKKAYYTSGQCQKDLIKRMRNSAYRIISATMI